MLRKIVLGILFGIVLAALSVTAQESDPASMSQSEVKALQREIQDKDRVLTRFTRMTDNLQAANRKSSNSSRRKAIDDLEKAMGQVIRAGEQKLGEEYLITQHGAEVEQVRTDDLGSGKGVNTRKRDYYAIAAEGRGPPPEYLRLARQQSIYVSCKTMREQAISKQGGSQDKYLSLSREFADLIEHDLNAMRARLPEESDPLADLGIELDLDWDE